MYSEESVYTLEKIVKKLEIVERKLFVPDSFELEIWYLAKLRLFKHLADHYHVFDQKGIRKDSHTKLNALSKKILNFIKTRIVNTLVAIVRLPRILRYKQKNYLFFGHPRRKKQKDGYYWDIYTDYISLQLLDADTVQIEKTFEGRHLKPVPTKHLVYHESIELLGLFQSIKNHKENKKYYYTNIMPLSQKIKAQFYQEFELDLNIEKILSEKYYGFLKQYYGIKKFLRYINPKVFFIVCAYGKEHAVRAARELGIPSVELQHGVINRYHLGYNFQPNFRKHFFPEYLFTFGSYWNNAANFPISDSHIFPVGYLHLERKIEKLKKTEKKKQIVFVSQATIGNKLSQFAIDLAKQIPNTKIYYKLHPGEVKNWRENYPKLYEADRNGILQVLSDKEQDLYMLLSESLIQIGVYSTALFEGARLGCFSFLVNLPGIEYMADFVEAGYGKLVNKADEIDIFNIQDINFEKKGDIFALDPEAKLKQAICIIEERYYNTRNEQNAV